MVRSREDIHFWFCRNAIPLRNTKTPACRNLHIPLHEFRSGEPVGQLTDKRFGAERRFNRGEPPDEVVPEGTAGRVEGGGAAVVGG